MTSTRPMATRELGDFGRHWDLCIRADVDHGLSMSYGVDRDAARDACLRTEALVRECHSASGDVHVAEADPRSRADVVVDNRSFDVPRLVPVGS